MTKVYTADEVAIHNSENDLWMIMHGGVYDITKFLQEHPGGEEVLLGLAGMDGTTCFEEMGHTAEAVQLRETFKIGTLAGGTTGNVKSASTNKGPKVSSVNKDGVTEFKDTRASNKEPSLPLMAAIVVIGIIAFYWLM